MLSIKIYIKFIQTIDIMKQNLIYFINVESKNILLLQPVFKTVYSILC